MFKMNFLPQQTARNYLNQYNGDLEAAIESLRSAQVGNQPSRKSRVSPDAPIVVETQDLTKRYKLGPEKVQALQNISIKIQQGEFVAITGESGSGKSTLLQLIGGLDKPSQGKVIVAGQELSKFSDRKLSEFRNKSIGFVFQFFYLQPFLSTQVNLEVPGMFARTPRATRISKAAELAGAVGLADRLRHLPKELSGGQMQRAAIARALFNQPKLLLADEPTGNLDQANSKSIIDLFETVRERFGTTVIIVTHDRSIAARADREISLNDGRLAGL